VQRLLGYHRFGLGVDGRDPLDVLQDEDNPHAYWNPEVKVAALLPQYQDRGRL
jgi:hypothetical protein